jgi:putative transposase
MESLERTPVANSHIEMAYTVETNTWNNEVRLQLCVEDLREQEAGSPTAEVCRKHGISSGTFYKWKAKFGGLDVSDAKRLKALEDENSKLKKLLAETMLDNAILKDINSRKW